MEFFDERGGSLVGGSGEDLCAALFVGQVKAQEGERGLAGFKGGVSRGEVGGGDDADFLELGAFDAHEGGVAELVGAGLNGEQGGGGHFDVLEPAVFELAEDLDAGGGDFRLEDECGVGDGEEFGEDDAGLTEAEVVGLEACEDEVGLFVADGGGEEAGDAEGVVGC